MVSKKVVAAAAIATVGVSAQVDAIIKSVAAQISNGLVAGRKSGVPESKAASEVGEIMSALNKNSDIQNLLTTVANCVLDGINSQGVVSIGSVAQASLAGFEGSQDYQTVSSLIAAHVTDLDPAAGFKSVSQNLAPVLNLVLPPISSLSAGDQNVASAVNNVKSMAVSVFAKFGLLGEVTTTSSKPASSTAGTSSASATASASKSGSTSPSPSGSSSRSGSSRGTATASIITKGVSTSGKSASTNAPKTSSVLPTVAPTTSVPQVNAQIALQGGAFVAGVVAAGALLL